MCQVSAFDATTGQHTVQDVHAAKHAVTTEPLLLVGPSAERWRRRDEPPPQPKFVWGAEAEGLLLQAANLEMAACDREAEWAKHAMPTSLAGQSAAHLDS